MTITGQSPVVERYLYDGDELLSVMDGGGGVVKARYFNGPGTDLLLAEETFGARWTLTDHEGSVRTLGSYYGWGSSGSINYDSFGKILPSSTASSRFGFAGREWDADAGLYYNRARYYDAGTGRFISQDPSGFGGGDENLYRYVGNDPVINTDPTGLCGSCVTSAGFSAVPWRSSDPLNAALAGTGAVSDLMSEDLYHAVTGTNTTATMDVGRMMRKAEIGFNMDLIKGSSTDGGWTEVGRLYTGNGDGRVHEAYDWGAENSPGAKVTYFGGHMVLGFLEVQPGLGINQNRPQTEAGYHGRNAGRALGTIVTAVQGIESALLIKGGGAVTIGSGGLLGEISVPAVGVGIVMGGLAANGTRNITQLRKFDKPIDPEDFSNIYQTDGGANPNTKRAASQGSRLHSDRPGNLPDQLRQKYPETEFKIKKAGEAGQDVEVVGGKHPSSYPNSTWPENVNHADFKPNTPGGAKTFKSDQVQKWQEPTHMLPYDPATEKLH